MQILTFAPKEYFGSNMYIISNDGYAAVIDPSVEYSKLSDVIDNIGLCIKFVVLTHSHFDHMLEVDSWIKNTDAALIVGELDAKALSDSYLNCYKPFLGQDKGYRGEYKSVSDGDELTLGDSKISVIHTPGHTEGSISLYFEDKVFVGDVVFARGGVGRVDLPGGSFVLLRESIKKILAMPDETVIYPGHGPTTTVKELKNYI